MVVVDSAVLVSVTVVRAGRSVVSLVDVGVESVIVVCSSYR